MARTPACSHEDAIGGNIAQATHYRECGTIRVSGLCSILSIVGAGAEAVSLCVPSWWTNVLIRSLIIVARHWRLSMEPEKLLLGLIFLYLSNLRHSREKFVLGMIRMIPTWSHEVDNDKDVKLGNYQIHNFVSWKYQFGTDQSSFGKGGGA